MRTKILLLIFLLVSPAMAQDSTAPVDPDQKSILAAAEAYQRAFNAKDASAIAKLFSPEAEISVPSGTVKGRQAIEADYSERFKSETPSLKLVDISVDIIAPSVAIETGVAVLTKGETSEEFPYRAVHVKKTEGWLVDRVQDEAPAVEAPSNYERLKVLEWLVGAWSLQTDNRTVTLSCRWTTNRNFLLQNYVISGGEGESDLEGTQVIGWDPAKKRIRSWLFDSDGGFGAGAWTGEGDTWSAQTIQVVPTGEEATCTNIYRRIDDSTMEFKSIARQVGGQLAGNIPAVTFVRQ